MANEIAKAVEQSKMGGTQKLSGSTATVQFQASAQRAPVGNNGFAEEMQRFVKAGTAVYGSYQEQAKKEADERSNEIIRKLTPEQRRAAIANGTLLYQDDPDAMNMLRLKSGRSAAYDVESEIQTKIQSGEFDDKDDKYLAEYRQQRLAQSAADYAKSVGIDENDPEYQKGFNADIVQRNAGIFDLHAQRRSKWYQAQAAVNTRGDLGAALADESIMNSPDGAQIFSGYINDGLKNGQFPSDKQALDSLNMLVKEAMNKPGGSKMLTNLGEQELNVLGGPRKIKDLLDPDVYQHSIVTAQANEYKRNADLNRDFELHLTTAVSQEDPATGMQQIQAIRARNNWIQDTGDMTPQKQALINAEQQLIQRVRQNSAKIAEDTTKAIQTDNRVAVIKNALAARIAGKQVSVDPKMQEVTADTGEFKDSDLATAASQIMQDIDRAQLPDDQKDQMRAAYLRADKEGGPFQSHYKALIVDAQREWANAVRAGEPGDMKRITELQRAYAADPATLGAVFPESADFLEQMKDAAESGIDPQILIDAERSKKVSVDERKFRDEKWTELMNDTSNKDLSSIPGNLQRTARTLYDGYNERTGNPEQAKQKLSEWLQKNTVAFTEPDDESAYRGRLSKKDLMADPNDVNSWNSGKEIIEDTLKGLAGNPEWADTSMDVTTDGNGNIAITSINGRRIRISRESLRLIHAARQQAAAEAKFQEEKNSTQRGGALYNQYMKGGAKGPL